MIVNELIGKKVVLHIETGGSVIQHRGVLEAVDSHFIKLRKDNETIFFCLYNLVGIGAV